MAAKFKLGDRVWYTELYWLPKVPRRAEVIGFDNRWGYAVTIRLDGTTGSVTLNPEVLTPLSLLDLMAESL